MAARTAVKKPAKRKVKGKLVTAKKTTKKAKTTDGERDGRAGKKDPSKNKALAAARDDYSIESEDAQFDGGDSGDEFGDED